MESLSRLDMHTTGDAMNSLTALHDGSLKSQSGVVGEVASRREFLRRSTAWGVSFLLPAIAPRLARGTERPRSLLTIWLGGGPSQLETWDPHPGTNIAGPTRAIDTSLRGVQFAEHFPRTAEQAHLVSVIRSLVSKEGDHERGTYLVKTGYRPDPTVVHPSLGAIIAHERPNPELEIPQYIALLSEQRAVRGGYLGADFDAFRIYDPGSSLANMRPRVGNDRQQKRLSHLAAVTQSFRRGRSQQLDDSLHQLTIERALQMMTSEQLQAVNLDNEPQSVRQSYGETRFGRGCLVARRLIETGVRAVEVSLSGWDTHANNFEGHANQAAILDPALSTLLRELEERDLLESTVVLCIGEFGRTPRINPLEGRDHWPTGFSALVGGAGLQSGVVIGETDPTGQSKQPTSPVNVTDLLATVLSVVGIDGQQEMISPIGRPLAICPGTPLEQLLAT